MDAEDPRDQAWHLIESALAQANETQHPIDAVVHALDDAGLLHTPIPRTTHAEDVDDLVQRLAAADAGYAYRYRTIRASPDYLRTLAEQVLAFRPHYLPLPVSEDTRKWLDMLLRAAREHQRGSALREIADKLTYALNAARTVPEGDTDSDYRLLADHIIALTNPPDDDAAEVHVVMEAVSLLHDVVVNSPCQCEDDYPCARCVALGRCGDVEVQQ